MIEIGKLTDSQLKEIKDNCEAEIKRRLDLRSDNLPLLNREEREFVANGKKVHAVKAYKDRIQCTLDDAIWAVTKCSEWILRRGKRTA